jgi:SAM-dependent methyltransferase
MVGVDTYMMSGAETVSESTRLRNIQQASDSFTIKHLEATGIGQGWRCLEIGAGGGSIAGWLGDRVGATGSVVATDVDLQRLGDLGAPVEVRRHDIAREGLESAAYDLVHCRLVLQHLTEPVVALQKMATAVAPGGWPLIEEGDFGLLEFAGAAESPRASIVLRDVFTRWAAAGVIDSYLGRRLLGLAAPSMSRRSASMLSPRSADPATQPTKRFAWPGPPPDRSRGGRPHRGRLALCRQGFRQFHRPGRRHHFRGLGPATTPQRQTEFTHVGPLPHPAACGGSVGLLRIDIGIGWYR